MLISFVKRTPRSKKPFADPMRRDNTLQLTLSDDELSRYRYVKSRYKKLSFRSVFALGIKEALRVIAEHDGVTTVQLMQIIREAKGGSHEAVRRAFAEDAGDK